MKFQRSSDGKVVSASVWIRQGDHPAVRQASFADTPYPSDLRRCGWLDGSGLVLPGDWIVEGDTGKYLVVLERTFRRDYAPYNPNLAEV